jgi:histidine decarboxylase
MVAVDLTQSVDKVLADLHDSLTATRPFDIGFPGATDQTYPQLAGLLTGHLLNNVGDPYDLGHGRNHTKLLEQEVVRIVGDLLRAPAGRWGQVTTGTSEGTLHALDEASQRYPDTIVYTSAAAHPSVVKAARRLKLPLIVARADESGQMDYDDLAGQLGTHRDRAAMIVATAGTTMSEAIDNVGAIDAVCEQLTIVRRRIHVDAALSGIPLALLPDAVRPAFNFTAGATSIVISGHKFLSTLTPCGVLIYADKPYAATAGQVCYTGSADATILGSRSGHTPLILWYILRTLGIDGLRARADTARDLAAHLHRQLQRIGWEATLNPHAMTVVLRTPPQVIRNKWVLAEDGPWSHIVCAPGVSAAQLDEFLTDMAAATNAAIRASNGRVPIPRQPRPVHPTTPLPA